jgi:putative protease
MNHPLSEYMNTPSTQQYSLPELLLPAGNIDRFRAAILYGANAVYLGGDTLNLRAASKGFSVEELKQAVIEANTAKASIYYCLNSFPLQQDMISLPDIIETVADAGVHGFIVADPGILRLVKHYAPDVAIHLSTQANTTNAEAIAFWQDQGVSRVNLARELSYSNVADIRKYNPDIELEMFVQGAMCLAVSGQCLLSNWLNNRPANAGRCTQPCRFEYKTHATSGFEHSEFDFSDIDDDLDRPTLIVEEQKRVGKPLWTVTEDENYSAFWAPDDLCLLPYLPWFILNNITSLKIEGRVKSAAYVAYMADVYSTAIRAAKHFLLEKKNIHENSSLEDIIEGFNYVSYLQELLSISSRPLSTGFFLGEEKRNLSDESKVLEIATEKPILARVVGRVEGKDDAWQIEVRGNWSNTQTAELMLPGMKRLLLSPGSYLFENHRREVSDNVGCGTKAILRVEHPDICPGIFIRLVQ